MDIDVKFKYVRKIEYIYAVHFIRSNIDDIVEFTKGQMEITIPRSIDGIMYGEMSTSNGDMFIDEGEYLAMDNNGNFYTSKEKRFNEICEKVIK